MGVEVGLTPLRSRSYTRFRQPSASHRGVARRSRAGNVGGPLPPFQLQAGPMAPIRRSFYLAMALFLTLPCGAAGQAFRVAGEQEVFHQTAEGRRLATLMRDAPVTAVGREGGWMEVTLEGWIW